VIMQETIEHAIRTREAKGAIISEDRLYRYALWRFWHPTKPYVCFIGLNPSTADAQFDDPTLRRCINFAARWGYGGMFMVNLFAWRSPQPKEMMKQAQLIAIGPRNDEALRIVTTQPKCGLIVAAWGKDGNHHQRAFRVLDDDDGALSHLNQGDLKCFGLTELGEPKHPLYLPNETNLMDYPLFAGV
jgi:hypothetical protein